MRAGQLQAVSACIDLAEKKPERTHDAIKTVERSRRRSPENRVAPHSRFQRARHDRIRPDGGGSSSGCGGGASQRHNEYRDRILKNRLGAVPRGIQLVIGFSSKHRFSGRADKLVTIEARGYQIERQSVRRIGRGPLHAQDFPNASQLHGVTLSLGKLHEIFNCSTPAEFGFGRKKNSSRANVSRPAVL